VCRQHHADLHFFTTPTFNGWRTDGSNQSPAALCRVSSVVDEHPHWGIAEPLHG
jgi:hypothetical protein